MKQCCKIYFLFFILLYKNEILECGFNQIPQNGLTDNNMHSFIQLNITQTFINNTLFVPKGQGVATQLLNMSQQQLLENQTINKNEEKSLPKLDNFQIKQMQNYKYVNYYKLQRFQLGSVSGQINQQQFSLQILIYSKDLSLKFMEIYQINKGSSEDCNIGLELQATLSIKYNYKFKLAKIDSEQYALAIFQTRDYGQSINNFISVLKLNRSALRTQFQVQQSDYNNYYEIHDLGTFEFNMQGVKNVFIKRFNNRGIMKNNFISPVDQSVPEKSIYIPRIFQQNSMDVYDFEFILSNNELKFYEIDVYRNSGIQSKVIGFYLQIDHSNINVLSIENMQDKIQNIYFTKNQHGLLALHKIKSVKINYTYFENNFATIDKFEFNTNQQNQLITDTHLLFHENNLADDNDFQRKPYQLLMTYKIQNQILEIQVILGPKESLKKKLKLLNKKQNFNLLNIQNINMVYTNTQFNDFSRSNNSFRLNYFYSQIKNIIKTQYEQYDQNFLQNYTQQRQTFQNVLQVTSQQLQPVVLQDDQNVPEPIIFAFRYDKNNINFQIYNFSNEELILKCHVSSVFEQELLQNIKEKKFKMHFKKENSVKLELSLQEDNDQFIIFDILNEDFEILLLEKQLAKLFCYTEIFENKVKLQFSTVDQGYIFQQSKYHQQGSRSIKIRQHMYLIDNRKIKNSFFQHINLDDVDFNIVHKMQYLILEFGQQLNIDSYSQEFFNLQTSDIISFEKSFNNDFDTQKKIRINFQTFSLNTQNQKKFIITKINSYIESIDHSCIYLLKTNLKQSIVFRYDYKNNLPSIPKVILYTQNSQKDPTYIIRQNQQMTKFENKQPIEVLARSELSLLDFHVAKNIQNDNFVYIYKNQTQEQMYMINFFYEPYKQSTGFLCMSGERDGKPNRFTLQLLKIKQLPKDVTILNKVTNDDSVFKTLISIDKGQINEHNIDMKVGYNLTSQSKNEQQFQYIFQPQLTFLNLQNFHTFLITMPDIDFQNIKFDKNKAKFKKDRNIFEGKIVFNLYKKKIIL